MPAKICAECERPLEINPSRPHKRFCSERCRIDNFNYKFKRIVLKMDLHKVPEKLRCLAS